MARCARKSDWYGDVSGRTCPTCKGTGHGTALDRDGKPIDSGACPTCGGFGKVES